MHECSDYDLGQHEQVVSYALCRSGECGKTDPIDNAITAYYQSIEEVIEEFHRHNPDQDFSGLHLVRAVHFNEGPLGQYHARQQKSSVIHVPVVEHPTGRTVGDLRDVFETLDLVLSATVMALGHRLTDDENPPEIQDEGVTLLVLAKYLRRLTDRGQRLIMAQHQSEALAGAVASVSLTGSS